MESLDCEEEASLDRDGQSWDSEEGESLDSEGEELFVDIV